MISAYRVEGRNPKWNDPQYLPKINVEFKEMWPWQEEALNRGKDARFFAIQAFCGSGKSILQVQLAIYDIISSNYTQKQLIVVPQEHIHRGFYGDEELDYLSVLQDGEKYQWNIQPDHNFCDGPDRVNNLKSWLLTPSKKLAKGFTEKTIGGLNAVCSHAALVAAWKELKEEGKEKQAIKKLTLRVDEAHHIKHVFLDEENFTDEEWLAIEHDTTELGVICKFFLNTKVRTCKLHLTTATMYRGDRKTILSTLVRTKFVEYNLDWIEHFERLGIKHFLLQYEFFKINPIKMIIKSIKAELEKKHYVVVPSTNHKWRDSASLNILLNQLYKLYPKERVLDLVTPSTQDANKKRLLAEPKVCNEENPSKFDVIVVCMLGREGTDWCPCSIIHNASVENSITLAVQTAGRAFRRYEGKETVKIYHYIKEFIMPRKSMTLTELLTDRTNALLVCMQFDDMNNTIIIPCMPEQGNDDENISSPTTTTTLSEEFGDPIDLAYGHYGLNFDFLQALNKKHLKKYPTCEICNSRPSVRITPIGTLRASCLECIADIQRQCDEEIRYENEMDSGASYNDHTNW